MVGRDRGAPRLPAGREPRRPHGAGRPAAEPRGRRRRPSAARSATATVACWPTAWTSTASTPCRRRSPTRAPRPSSLCQALDQLRRRRSPGARRAARPASGAFAYVQRFVSPQAAARVAALDLEGIGFMKENKRFYPNKELGGAGARLRRRGQRRPRRHRGRLRQGDQRTARHGAGADRCAASRLQQRDPAADHGRRARTDHRRAAAAHRRARARGRRDGEQGRRRHRRADGPEHRRDPGDGQLPDVQPERVQRGHRPSSARTARSPTSTNPARPSSW